MALTVGELNGIITIDDRGVHPGLRRAEQAMRQAGQHMGDDAERAGQAAGQQLGEGLVRGADGQWRNMRGELVDAVTAAAAEAEARAHRAGRQIGDGVTDGLHGLQDDAQRAGQQAGDGLGEGLADGADAGVAEAGTRLEKLKTIAGGAAAAAGAAAGALLVAGITEALDQSRIVGRLGAQMGKTPKEAQRYGKIAGQLYADAVTEDFQGAADAISATMAAGLLPPNATNAQIKSISSNLSDLSSTFELDLGQSANAIGQILKTGLAKDAQSAFDVMTRGMQVMGPRADDLADTFNEYSTVFRQLGVDAPQVTGLMAQGMAAGARDTDVIADSLKEFVLIAQGGGKTVDEAFGKIGLSGKAMQKAFSEGGPKARKALDQVFDRLRTIKDPAERAQIALALFGTKAEDTQKALFSLDPSEATKALGEVGGAADKMGTTLRDNAGTKLEAFKRGMQQKVVTFLGGTVLPSMATFRSKARSLLGGVWDEAGKDGERGAERIAGVALLIAKKLGEKVIEAAPQIASAVAGLGGKIAEYVMQNPMGVFKIVAIAGAFLTALVALPALVAAGISAVAISLMVGFVGRLISALQTNIPKWWSSFTGWVSKKASEASQFMAVLGTAIGSWFGGLWSKYVSGPVSRTWNSWLTSVRGLPGRTTSALSSMGSSLATSASNHWNAFKSAAARRGGEFIAWVRGLPGRAVSAMGGMTGLLVIKGVQLVQGLWAGVSSMGGWLASKLSSWAKSVIPGPIAKALGISSPSKVTTAQGRWIARGLIAGITGSTKQVKAASTKLADIIRDGLNPGKKRSKALATISAGTKKLLKFASQEEKVAARLKAAQKSLTEYIAARDKLAADVKKGVLDAANITTQTGSEGNSAESILDSLRANRRAAEKFAADLAKLRAKGVRADLIAQIAQAGVAQGSSAAAALAHASANQIKQINSEQSALVKAAGNAGSTAGNAMYGAGIQAAQGLVRGLQSQQKAIERQMLTIARSMSKSIKRALGIKSPSRVMAAVGAYTAEGLRRGIESGRTAVNRSMSSLVETPSPSAWALDASGRSTSGTGRAPRVVRIGSDGSKFGDLLVSELRRKVQNIGGGDVQFVLGKGA
ncbi:phage tail tape measure protein [Streptomyces bobili]|uniref:phage tail tape measure protein n=1 Tax=Streptomyces bobili TaxID=67280 RepID=UPI000A3C11CB|nr:phage tail tape measure protein [Streptomyces bobili]